MEKIKKMEYKIDMIKEFLNEKKERRFFYKTEKFNLIYDELYDNIKDNPVFIENLNYIKLIDSIFEMNKDKVFFQSYSYYGVVYNELIFYKFYVDNNLTYIVSPLKLMIVR